MRLAAKRIYLSAGEMASFEDFLAVRPERAPDDLGREHGGHPCDLIPLPYVVEHKSPPNTPTIRVRAT
jgi:hypothetical protein